MESPLLNINDPNISCANVYFVKLSIINTKLVIIKIIKN